MPDKKTIIKVLEGYKTCTFGDKDERVTVADILDLLKVQEPETVLYINTYKQGMKQGNCPKCGAFVSDTFNIQHCGICGMKVI